MEKTGKGISPLVATILLILVVIVASVLLYDFLTELSSSTKERESTGKAVPFKIEAANLYHNTTFNTTTWGSGMDLYIRNTGNSLLKNGTWSLYILDAGDKTIIVSRIWSFYQDLAPGEVYVWFLALSYNSTIIEEGKPYIVKVVSPQGVANSVYVTAT